MNLHSEEGSKLVMRNSHASSPSDNFDQNWRDEERRRSAEMNQQEYEARTQGGRISS